MAQYGRFATEQTDTSGNAVSGANVTIYPQGALVSGAVSNNIFNVYDTGGLVVGETVRINLGSTTRSITALSATQVTVGGLGFNGVQQYDRINQITSLPTLYKDAVAGISTGNPLTTDSNGYASCYLPVGKYDVQIIGGTPSLTARLYQDVGVTSGETFRSTVFDGATVTAWVFDTLRSLVTAGAKLLSLRTAASEKFSVAYDGSFTAAGGATIAGAVTENGALTNNVSITVAGPITTTGAGGTLTTSRDITTRRLLTRQGTALTTGDFALSAGFGSTASVSFIAGAIAPMDTRGTIRITSAGVGQGVNPTVTLTFKDGTYGASSAPMIFCQRDGTGNIGMDQPTVQFNTLLSPTGPAFRFNGTPVAGEIYGLSYLVIG